MVCPRAQSRGRSCSHKTLLPSVKLFKIILAYVSTSMLVTHSYMFISLKRATQAFDRLKNCLDDVRKWLSANKLKLNPDKTEFILSVQNSANFSQLIYLVTSSHLLMQLRT